MTWTATFADPGLFFIWLQGSKVRNKKTETLSLYDKIGTQYSQYRKPDSRIAAAILREIGDRQKILNLGAGVGAYEPLDRNVVALEPSKVMISHRSAHTARVVQGRAESLPFRDNTFEITMAVLTVHHWSDIEKGLREALRVAQKQVILLTWIGFVEDFWLVDYLPQIKEIDEGLFYSVAQLEDILGPVRVIPIPIPHDCTDGFLCAYWRRPHFYLDEAARRAISTFARIKDIHEGLRCLEKDLESGLWQDRYRYLLNKESMDFGYRLVISADQAV
ncbi:MAG: class I SAM-dependent methyltransferase [Deltaproteobacteria bacterium]|jgi:SAM-dependent methyltransferase|nr:class I SAM-dependent methyltransferase [Deltaproteobacteria bacterium]